IPAAIALLFMNYSRTAILALMVEALVLPFLWLGLKSEKVRSGVWKLRSVGRLLLSALILLVVISSLVMVFPDSRERVESSFDKFKQGGASRLLEARYYHWGNTLMMIKENPVLGVGLGNWRFCYPLYYKSFAQDPLLNYRVQVRKVHNDYLQLAAECGIPALLLFLLLWGRQFYLMRYSTAESDGGEDWRIPLVASLLAFSVIMFFSFPMQMAYSRMFCFFLLALGEARAWPALSK
ncbi:MAG: O-antigen ligase family protein, partial [Pseudomonadota bacterium]|nr:O-antigen ligase family protein [Pseudomonadota bacterium]